MLKRTRSPLCVRPRTMVARTGTGFTARSRRSTPIQMSAWYVPARPVSLCLFFTLLQFFCGPAALSKQLHVCSNKYSTPNGTKFFFGKGVSVPDDSMLRADRDPGVSSRDCRELLSSRTLLCCAWVGHLALLLLCIIMWSGSELRTLVLVFRLRIYNSGSCHSIAIPDCSLRATEYRGPEGLAVRSSLSDMRYM